MDDITSMEVGHTACYVVDDPLLDGDSKGALELMQHGIERARLAELGEDDRRSAACANEADDVGMLQRTEDGDLMLECS